MYARLVDGADAKARDEFDRTLNAPVAGWEAVERRFFALIEEAG